MRTFFACLTFLFLTGSVQAQPTGGSGDDTSTIGMAAPDRPSTSLDAAADIRAGKLKFYGGAGIFVRASTDADREFTKKYAVSYRLIGCVLQFSIEEYAAYNTAIAEHLDITYGPGWRKFVRGDILGLTRS